MLEDKLFCPMNMVYLLEQLDAGRVAIEESHNHGYRFLRVRDLQLYYTTGACFNVDQWLKVKHDVYYFLYFLTISFTDSLYWRVYKVSGHGPVFRCEHY